MIRTIPSVAAAAALVLAGCATRAVTTNSPAAMNSDAVAVDTLRDAMGRLVGVVHLEQTPVGVLVRGDLRGVTPGQHGLHVHTLGQCAPSFAAAGPHWNLTGTKHGYLTSDGPHSGDLPNVYVGENGLANFDLVLPGAQLIGAPGILDQDGAALVLHARGDDYHTDPAGNSGDRIACGVVTAIR